MGIGDGSSSSSGDEITADHVSGSSSKSASPTSDLGCIGLHMQQYKYRFDHKESHAITDVLICHTDVHEFRYNITRQSQ